MFIKKHCKSISYEIRRKFLVGVFPAFAMLVTSFLLSGCAFDPTNLGVSKAEWQGYGKDNQKQLLANYNQISAENKLVDQPQQAPGANGAQPPKSAGGVDVDAQSGSLGDLAVSGDLGASPSALKDRDVKLEVRLFGGTAMMPPFVERRQYVPVVFQLKQNSCQEALLQQLGSEDVQVSLRACFDGKLLRLDPSRYELAKKGGTLSVPYSPIWDQGFVYRDINTDGYVKLRNAAIAVKKI